VCVCLCVCFCVWISMCVFVVCFVCVCGGGCVFVGECVCGCVCVSECLGGWVGGDWSNLLKIRHPISAVVLGFVCCWTKIFELNEIILCMGTKPSKLCFHLSLCITIPPPLRLHFLSSRHEFCRHRNRNAWETNISSVFPSWTLSVQFRKILLSRYYYP